VWISNINVRQFRNYNKLQIDFNKGYNLIYGNNGQGKTNLLEAIYLLGLVKGFRSLSDNQLIQNDLDYYYIKGSINYDENDIENELAKSNIDNNINKVLEIGYKKNEAKQLKVDKIQINRVADFIGQAKIVVILNQDNEYIIGSPSNKRQYIDITLSLSDDEYLTLLQKYNKVLKNRNISLKKGGKEFEIWNMQLIEYGSMITVLRNKFLKYINPLINTYYFGINQNIQNFKLVYQTQLSDANLNDIESVKEQYNIQLKRFRDVEINKGNTLVGIHRDNINFYLGDKELKYFASQGQIKAAALSLKLAMINYIEKSTKLKTIILLDDVLLDLDEAKREAFLRQISEHQVFYTTTHLYGMKPLFDNASIYHVENGNIKIE